MPSPQGLFVGLTQTQLNTFRDSAINAILNGQRVSLSGGAKSGSKIFKMDPQEVLFEVNYAQGILNGTPRAQKVVQIINDQYATGFPETINIP